jgi:hypothetical protein
VEVEAAEALPRITPPRPVIDPLGHRLAELAVAGNVDPGGALAFNDPAHRGAQSRRKRVLTDALASEVRPGLNQFVRARQAAGVAG